MLIVRLTSGIFLEAVVQLYINLVLPADFSIEENSSHALDAGPVELGRFAVFFSNPVPQISSAHEAGGIAFLIFIKF